MRCIQPKERARQLGPFQKLAQSTCMGIDGAARPWRVAIVEMRELKGSENPGSGCGSLRNLHLQHKANNLLKWSMQQVQRLFT